MVMVFLLATAGMTLLGPAEVIVGEAPVIDGASPEAQTVLTGDAFSFSVEATGDSELSYQWLHNGEELSGETNPSLFIELATLSDAGDYICRVTSGLGCSADSLKGILSVDQRLLFTQHPSNANKTVGESLILQAEAIGVGGISYTWEKDGELVPGATSRILYIESLVLEDAGSYVCLATDSRVPPQEASSNSAIVTVYEPSESPAIFTLSYDEEGEELAVVFNNNGATLDGITVSSLPEETTWEDVVSLGIRFIDQDEVEVFEGYPLTITENQDTDELIFIGVGEDWDGNPSQTNLAEFDGRILPWFEVSTDPGKYYFVNAGVVVVELDGDELDVSTFFYLLSLP
ncbi:MAG TPA: hypothetical protein ENN31_02175 [Candidatus Vogelbacteria bacterium]|nr:hypothetical protein [Candidatus Vogelbacteria bacterium]